MRKLFTLTPGTPQTKSLVSEGCFRSVTSKPTVSGLSASSILKNSHQNVSLATVFLCPDQSCKLKLPSRATLLTHFKMCHTREITEEEERQGQEQTTGPLDYESDPDDPKPTVRARKEYVCNECGYVSATSNSHKKHMKSCHDETKTYDCPDCGVKVTRKYHLLRHIKAVHEKEKFWQCDSCEYQDLLFAILDQGVPTQATTRPTTRPATRNTGRANTRAAGTVTSATVWTVSSTFRQESRRRTSTACAPGVLLGVTNTALSRNT